MPFSPCHKRARPHPKMAPQNTLPPEIQLCILTWLMEPDNSSNGSRTHLSLCACVCKHWQLIVEQRTFRHFILHPSDIQDFAGLARPYRRGYIKHIVLEIPIEDADDRRPHNHALNIDENNVVFTQAARNLWEVLSAWRNHRLTVELGIVSSFEMGMDHDDYRNIRASYANFLKQGFSEPASPDPHLEHLKRFEDVPTDISWLDVWNWQKWRFLGTTPLDFDFGRHLSGEDQSARNLPKVQAIACLLIRRRYFRNISAKALSQIFKAAPCLEVIHLERWCYGRRRDDKKWDIDSALLGHELPPSLKQFSFYEEFSTAYHQQPRKMTIPRLNRRLLKAMIKTSRHLEHISISFAIDARDFFLPNPQLDGGVLITIALTSDTLVSHSSAAVNELLENIAEAAKKMPKLKVLEIWYCKTGEAGIFRYEKSDRSGNMTWLGTWSFDISKQVKQAWHEVFANPDGGLYGLDIKVISLPPEEIASVGSVVPYLKLKKHILHDVSWTQV
ncbi:hypothetical protein EDB81DRAFT_832203 [Dactylonectria macrodidyma]|uniref:F-box domain-containing protein n=1 Tax=Dactylonectria macrodidyma TaxID=307937 RepID=A0A9P9D055_9HYPO|nr:hypothetical protein EDB81DRAFT_832203 [Dactylonectria macrodidyma]